MDGADAGASADARSATNIDAATVIETEVIVVPGSASAPTSCDALCGTKQYDCSPECGPNADRAGSTVYRYDSSSGISSYQQPPIYSCAEAVPASYLDFSDLFELQSYDCCCRGPVIRRIAGPTDAPQSCESLCQANGLGCEADTNWGIYGINAMKLHYLLADSDLYTVRDCLHVPSQSYEGGTLGDYSCGCR